MSLRQSSRMSKLEVSVGLDTSGRKGAGSLCREPQSRPEKNRWLLKSLEPFLPRRISLSQMSPVMKEWALSEMSGPERGNSKYSWRLKKKIHNTMNNTMPGVYTICSDTTDLLIHTIKTMKSYVCLMCTETGYFGWFSIDLNWMYNAISISV